MGWDGLPVVKILFKLVQEIPPFFHLWVTVGIICCSDSLCGGGGELGRVDRECGTRCDHT